MIQECAAGLVTIRRVNGQLHFGAPPAIRDGPLEPETLDAICAASGIAADEVVAHAYCDNGPGWAVVQLPTAARVLELKRPATCSVLNVGLVGLHEDGTPELRAWSFRTGMEDPVRRAWQNRS